MTKQEQETVRLNQEFDKLLAESWELLRDYSTMLEETSYLTAKLWEIESGFYSQR